MVLGGEFLGYFPPSIFAALLRRLPIDGLAAHCGEIMDGGKGQGGEQTRRQRAHAVSCRYAPNGMLVVRIPQHSMDLEHH